jgi:DNA-binding response OmpR family regulator
MTRGARVLIAIPEGRAAASARAAVERTGHVVRVCAPEEVGRQADVFRPDLVITASEGPRGDELVQLLERIDSSHRPLVLCLLPDGASATASLAAGADACLVGSCEPADLEAHVGALLRRVPWLGNAVHQVGPLVVDEASHVALFDDVPLRLTVKEFAILVVLVREAGHVVSKRSLLERVWRFEAFDENLVEAHVCGLRRHLPPHAAAMVQTVRGVGYVLRAEVAQAAPA